MRRLATPILLLAALALPAGAARGEIRDAGCVPSAVRLDELKLEIHCTEPVLLNTRSRDRFREVRRFAYPMVSQSYQPQLGSQVKLLDYYLQLAESAVVHSLRLHVWFESDYAQSRTWGCDPRDCRALVALAITHEPAAAPPASDEEALSDSAVEQ